MATWRNYFHTDNHLWFTAMGELSQHDTFIRTQLLPNICQKPFHYVYFGSFCSSPVLLLKVAVQGRSFWRMRLACLGRGGLGSGCVVRGESDAVVKINSWARRGWNAVALLHRGRNRGEHLDAQHPSSSALGLHSNQGSRLRLNGRMLRPFFETARIIFTSTRTCVTCKFADVFACWKKWGGPPVWTYGCEHTETCHTRHSCFKNGTWANVGKNSCSWECPWRA